MAQVQIPNDIKEILKYIQMEESTWIDLKFESGMKLAEKDSAYIPLAKLSVYWTWWNNKMDALIRNLRDESSIPKNAKALRELSDYLYDDLSYEVSAILPTQLKKLV